MSLQRLFVWTALAVLFTLVGAAADFGGKWTAQVPGRDGQPQPATFNLKVDGDKVTGAMSSQRGDIEIKDGKISGDTVTFKVVREFGGNSITFNYEGKAAGNEIKFKRSVEGRDGVQEFTAKRAES